MHAETVLDRLRQLGNPKTAAALRWFFKTGPGEYGEGDTFVGVKVPPLRKLAREFAALSLEETEILLHSRLHEARLLALLILGEHLGRGDNAERKAIFELYLRNTAWVNNWDLVDASARTIGLYLQDRSRRPLYRLARSRSLWERRIAIVATGAYIQKGDFSDTLKIAHLLLADREDLIHKAVGWMLREVGKRDLVALEQFLLANYRHMPRTMLRYAIERFPEPRRQQYLKGEL